MSHEKLHQQYPWTGFSKTVENLARSLTTHHIYVYSYFSIPPQGERSGEILPGMYTFRVLLAGRKEEKDTIEKTELTLDNNGHRYQAHVSNWHTIHDLSQEELFMMGIVLVAENPILRENAYMWIKK